MKYRFADLKEASIFHFLIQEEHLERRRFDEDNALLTIAWNRGEDQVVTIDGVDYPFPKNTVLPLLAYNIFSFRHPTEVVAWQFNREFYCIIDHEEEVSCAGFLFYGSQDFLFIKLDEKHQRKYELLIQVFEEEFSEEDNIQGEMLRMLLKRLIILTTRVGKQQFIGDRLEEGETDLVRSFNLLVEKNFRTHHQVQDYASMLNKSPKTLTNLFAKYNSESPLQVIKNRIVLEAKRLLKYTDRTSKEIAFDLGFDEPASFSRFFKNQVGLSPTHFQKQ